MSWFHGTVARLRLLFRRGAESRMDEEFRFHIDMEAERLIRERNLEPNEARRQARAAFGGVESHKEELREGRGFAWLNGLSLDLKLGIRMLFKYPGLSVTGVVGMGMAVAIGATMFTVIELTTRPKIRLPEGDRIVGIRSWDTRAHAPGRATAYDYATWQELKSMDEVAAFRMGGRNLIMPNGTSEPVEVAEMSASGFRIARVAPFLGRYLLDEDERIGSPRVVVIGHGLWQTRFDGDAAIIGKTLRLGAVEYTIVGVMPKGFAFPIAHEVWTPLQVVPQFFASGQGPELFVFGRLASGITRTAAQAELTAVGRGMASDNPDTHNRLDPRVVHYAMLLDMSADDQQVAFFSIQGLLSMILVVIAVNVAALVYARTATRRSEIAVRASLGASRRRIMGQLFAEALVLSTVAAAVGLCVAVVSYRLTHSVLVASGMLMPFWLAPKLSLGTIAYVVALALLGALIIGVLPARTAAGSGVRTTLAELSGGTTLRLPKSWTVLIVAQVAVAVAVLPSIVYLSGSYVWYSYISPGFPAEQYLTARIELEATSPGQRAAVDPAKLLRTLESRLAAEPNVAAVTFSSDIPGQEPEAQVELERATSDSASGTTRRVRMMSVATDYFEAFDVPTLAGRRFHGGDIRNAAAPIIVNQTFVRDILGGGNAVGHRVRQHTYSSDTVARGPWLEIVGVVPDFPPNRMNPVLTEARVYQPMAVSQVHPVVISTRMSSTPAASSNVLRKVATAIDPEMRLREILTLDEVYRTGRRGMGRLAGLAMGLVTLSVLVLSAAGMYALMSFTVTRRRREIGIRSALGANPRHLLASVFSRALLQLAIGGAVGLAVAAVLDRLSDEFMGGYAHVVLPAVLTVMMVTGLLAALGPARRGLRIHPADALKSE